MGCFGKLRHKKRAANNQTYNDAALKSNITSGTKDGVEVTVEARVEVVVEAGVVLVMAGVWDITEGVEGAVVEAEDAVEVEAVEVHGLDT
ncbi:hypothetical protein Ddye_010821 [Dipteronia dyeriana]|uniref:Uncharacterized protein n=1 Tax=Dipteronia dyeriana TaxID=168575 RepID=A0AAD9XE37_9ROSI|nr:hypothetical protein Ddye_010821 [Dipteronia dyeriana]